MGKEKPVTPLMRQYWDIKSLHQDKIVLFRMGDFFEMFFDDAVQAAPILGIALTSRNKKAQDETPMCGVPHHSVGGAINKLLAAGLKVAICDQIEDPKFAKGIVKRAVTRVLTPGVVYDPQTLKAQEANYIASWKDAVLACLDPSTGEAIYWRNLSDTQAASLVGSLPIVEMIKTGDEEFPFPVQVLVSAVEEGEESTADSIPVAASRLLRYVQSLGSGCEFLRPFEERTLLGRLEISKTSLRHLEIFESSRGTLQGSLFAAIDRTKTSQGARLLRSRLAFPETRADFLEKEWQAIGRWMEKPSALKALRETLSHVGDLERRLTRLGPSTANARDLRSLAESLEYSLRALEMAGQDAGAPALHELVQRIESTVVEEPPLSVKQGYMIREGVASELDEAIRYSTRSQELLQELESRERQATGIPSLKVRYNNVFGYYIEITNTHRDKAPAHYQRKQTLANAERFTTDELTDLEQRILSAQTRRFDLEFEIFEDLKRRVITLSAEILTLARRVAELDVRAAWAHLALERNYTRPALRADGHLLLKASRHPVVEQSVSFIPNDIVLEKGGCLLLTGPNMAGKSTLMRQVALIALMAQAGGYVPAAKAELPLFDRILTRIGAQDSLAEGLSTFMVEMTETAEILRQADGKSLILLDEIGRGTSTFDGMSLAQAILEYLLQNSQSLVFFATHYHELTRLAGLFPRIHNGHMAMSERKGEIHFLYALRPGPALKSYGIHVAQLAGLPKSLTNRAQELLRGHEGGSGQMSFGELSLHGQDQ